LGSSSIRGTTKWKPAAVVPVFLPLNVVPVVFVNVQPVETMASPKSKLTYSSGS
jgi:hypothetical protein